MLGVLMEVHFRVDSSNTLGLGHLSRCLNLADRFGTLGHECKFFCRDLPGHFTSWVTERGHEAYILQDLVSVKKNIDEKEDYNLYLKSRYLLNTPDWIVVDSYLLGKEWEEFAKNSSSRLLVIDDFIDRPHSADLYLNQNLILSDTQSLERNGIKVERFLLGPQFALLSSEYSKLRKSSQPRSGFVEKIFVYFGGVDEKDYLTRSLKCIHNVFSDLVSVVLVAPEMGPNYQSVLNFCANHQNIQVFRAGASLANLMMESQLAIGACGSTTWERACLGLPSLGVAFSRNQALVAKNAGEAGACYILPESLSRFEIELSAKLTELKEFGLTKSWSEKCFEVCDGFGSQRIANEIASFNLTTI